MEKIKNPWLHKEGYNCIGCCPTNPIGVKLSFYEEGEDIVSSWEPKANFQGWVNTLHGGIQALLLDEICSWVVFRKMQTYGVTSKMETRYLKSILITDGCISLRARMKETRRNIAIIEAELYNKEGELCTSAVCTYFTFNKEKAKESGFYGCELENK